MKVEVSKANESIQAEWGKKYKLRNELLQKFQHKRRLQEMILWTQKKKSSAKIHTAKILTEQKLSKKKILDKLATEKVRTELKLEAVRFKKQQEPIKQTDSDLKNIFELNFNDHILEEFLDKWVTKLEKQKSQQKFSKKDERFIKN